MFNIFNLKGKFKRLEFNARSIAQAGKIPWGVHESFLTTAESYRVFNNYKKRSFGSLLVWLPCTPHFFARLEAAHYLKKTTHKMQLALKLVNETHAIKEEGIIKNKNANPYWRNRFTRNSVTGKPVLPKHHAPVLKKQYVLQSDFKPIGAVGLKDAYIFNPARKA